jgi:hypothetical protein
VRPSLTEGILKEITKRFPGIRDISSTSEKRRYTMQ